MKRHGLPIPAAVVLLGLCGTAAALPPAGGPHPRPTPTATPNPTPAPPAPLTEFRSIDGTGNNLAHPHWGVAESAQARFLPPAYESGSDVPAGSQRPSARAISNAVCAQTASRPNQLGASDIFWQWGQFIDHDMVLTLSADPEEPFPIPVPAGDPYFDPFGTGTQTIGLDRSQHVSANGIRQQVNALTSVLDASMVYGSDEATMRALRTLDGTGRLRTSDDNLLPIAEDGFFFDAGDIRVNEQIGLIAMQTLFLREHNFWADTIRNAAPPPAPPPFPGLPTVAGPLDDEKIFQLARAIVAAEIQCITYREYLPLLLGSGAMAPYRGYNPGLDPSIRNEFAVAAYRFGHSMLSPELLRLGADGAPIPQGNVALADAFFAADSVRETGIDPILRGLARQRAQELDTELVDGVRNFLFGPPGAGGFDLASLNIQRGRDHGLPSYNTFRLASGRPRATSFAHITRDGATAAKLASVYASPDDVDPWVGMLAEDDIPGALAGPTMRWVLARQFEHLRDGDRFWYQNYLPPPAQRFIERQTLATIIRRNTGVHDIQSNPFRVAAHNHPPRHPKRHIDAVGSAAPTAPSARD